MDKKIKKTFPKEIYVFPDFPYKTRPRKEGDWWLCEDDLDMIDANTDVGIYVLKEIKRVKRRTTLE
jgi:hypothetical protein